MFLLCNNVSCLGLTRHWNGTLELVVSMWTIHLLKEQLQTLHLSKRRLRTPSTTSHPSKAKHSYTQFTTTSQRHKLLPSNMSYPAPESMRTTGQRDWRWACILQNCWCPTDTLKQRLFIQLNCKQWSQLHHPKLHRDSSKHIYSTVVPDGISKKTKLALSLWSYSSCAFKTLQ